VSLPSPDRAHADSFRLLRALAGVAAIYHLAIASRALTWVGIFVPPMQHRAVSLLTALLLVFLPGLSRRAPRRAWMDGLFLSLGVIGVGYVALAQDAILDYSQYGYLDPPGVALALASVVAILEAVRRKIGLALPVIIVFFALITIFQAHLPGVLYGKGYALDRLTYSVYVAGAGIFGTPLGVAATILITFIVFGRLLEASGAGQWFVRLTMCAAGWTTGGAAKVAILASALFGMVSGSPSANIATVGVVTIPLMVRSGYPARVAAAVEATASTGGQFMPPVMGAVAFIMAESLAIPYSHVAMMAALPALLYFAVLFISVHLEAARRGLPALPRHELPRVRTVLKEGWFYAVPFAVLLHLLLVRSYPPDTAGLVAALALVPVSFLAGDARLHLTPARIWRALTESMGSWLPVAAVTAAVGILIGALELSGLGVKFSAFIVDVSGGSRLATLVLVGLGSFVLGMGLDSIPAYLTLTVLAAPALMSLGLPLEVAHLFVLYWGLSSFITPPTCIAVYVACGISGSRVWETGWEAVRLGIAAYLVPFAFVYHPALLLRGTLTEVLLAVPLALIASAAMAAALRGYARGPLVIAWRLLLASGAMLILAPQAWTTIAGTVIVIVSVFAARARRPAASSARDLSRAEEPAQR
jgi:TRAP transporter 4TM/12TM fusion protein